MFFKWFSPQGRDRVAACGFKTPPDSVLNSNRWADNNEYLIDVLNEAGYNIPSDYFENVDEKGNYKGRISRLNHFTPDGLSIDPQGPLNNTATYYFPIKVWVHQNAAGVSPFTLNEIDIEINNAIAFFEDRDSPIVFYRLNEITFINNSPHNDLADEAEEDDMFDDYSQGGAINVHLVEDGFAAGSADGIPGSSCWIQAGANENTVAHELGHCFGLLHTHNAFPPCVDDDNDGCADCWQEPVSRSRKQPVWCVLQAGKTKCSAYGDQLCDTPAEESLFGLVDENCQTQSNETDNWGDVWQPMTFNLMSAALPGGGIDCRDLLSIGQFGVMLASMPLTVPTNPGYVLSGPASSCTNLNKIYSVPALAGVTTYTWEVTNGATIVAGQGTNQITVSFPATGSYEITVFPNCCFPLISRTVNARSSISISGPNLVIVSSNESYYTHHIEGANYNWTVPAGWVLTSGQGTYQVNATTSAFPSQNSIAVSMTAPGCAKNASRLVTVQANGGVQYMVPGEGFTTGQMNKSEESYQIIDIETGKIVNEADVDYEQALMLLPKGFYSIKQIKGRRKAGEKKVIKK